MKFVDFEHPKLPQVEKGVQTNHDLLDIAPHPLTLVGSNQNGQP